MPALRTNVSARPTSCRWDAVGGSSYDRDVSTASPSPSGRAMPAPPGVGGRPASPGRVRSRARRAWALIGSLALVLLCALLAMSAGGVYGTETSTFPAPLQAYSMAGAFLVIGASVLLVWRHRHPVVVSCIATAAVLVVPTTALPALVALAAVTAARTGWRRWGLIAGTYAATIVAFCWDLAGPQSYLGSFLGQATPGTAAPASLYALTPVAAALCVAPFAAFGIARHLRRERDTARDESAAANRVVSVLHREVERERERQTLARELHDTLAADLSQTALHAGALELMVGQATNPKAVAAARTVRESTQNSLDHLRQLVTMLRDPDRRLEEASALSDLPALIDDAVHSGTDVRAQLFVDDPASCDRAVAHACYRLAQEAISNARRHAAGSVVTLDVRGGPATGLTVRAANWLTPAAAPTSRGGGNGLRGMRERTELVGGTFQAGPTAEGTFAVVAWLPWSVAA